MMRAKLFSLFVFLILILVVLALSVVIGFTPVADRLGWRANVVSIYAFGESTTLDRYEFVFITGEDTLRYNGIDSQQLQLPDWYGQDHAYLIYKNRAVPISYGNFKYRSWEKVQLQININRQSSEISWHLKSFRVNRSGKMN